MIRSAVAVGFAVFVGPLVIAELVFLGALYLVWRGLGGGEPASMSEETPRSDARGHRAPHSFGPTAAGRRAAGDGLRGRSLLERTGG